MSGGGALAVARVVVFLALGLWASHEARKAGRPSVFWLTLVAVTLGSVFGALSVTYPAVTP